MYPNGTNPRDQFETMEFLNALALINGAGTTQTIQTGAAPVASNKKSDATTVTATKGIVSSLLGMAAGIWTVFAL
jgi:hypothetical protein